METSGELKIAHVLRRLLDREQVTLRQLRRHLTLKILGGATMRKPTLYLLFLFRPFTYSPARSEILHLSE